METIFAHCMYSLSHFNKLAPDEKKVADKIEARQREILIKNNIDPDKGLRDLSKVRVVYANDREVLERLVIVASKEEMLTNEVLGEAVVHAPESMHQMQQLMHNFPQMMAQLQSQIEQNPQLLSQMSPQQQAQYHHYVALSGRLQHQHNQGHPGHQERQLEGGLPPQEQAPAGGWMNSLIGMFGYSSQPPVGRAMTKDDK